jgi:tRNA(Ile)-lysidine synthase
LRKTSLTFSPSALSRILFEHLGIKPGANFKLAFSGGLDSHVLLHALVQVRAHARLQLTALHIDHGLQPMSHAWARHCRQVCKQLDVACIVESIQVERDGEKGLEAAARTARYDKLRAHIALGEILLTAHHQDDQAETFLLQLFRGAGMQGLAAMPEITEFGPGRLARPLLAFPRHTLEEYARVNDLHWIEDASNQDRRYARNFIRHQVLPLIRAQWPQATKVLARTAAHAADAAALLNEIATADLALCRVDGDGLLIPALRKLSPSRLRNLIRAWLRAQAFLPPNSLHLAQIIQQLFQSPKTRHGLIKWPGVEIHRYRDVLHVMPALPDVPELDIAWDLSSPLSLPAIGYRLRVTSAIGMGLSQDKVAGRPLRVRLRQGGERCRLPGRAHHHKLKKLLQERGVPPWQRARLPLLYAGEELAAVGDLWVCEPYQARPQEAGLVVVLDKLGSV